MKKKLTFFIISMMIILSIGFTAAASSNLVDIRAFLNKGLTFTIDGAPWQPKTGEQVLYPITYEGATYLPVRAVAEALNVPIQWDAENYAIHIGGTSELIPILSESHGLFSATITADEVNRKFQGADYGEVIWFEKVLNSVSRFQLEPAGQYGKLYVKAGIEGDDTQFSLVNADTSSEIKSVLLTEEDGLVEIEANITGVQKVMIHVMTAEPNTKSSVRIITKESYYTTE